MRVGRRSILIGAHAFWLHPFLVALAWWRLFGFPTDLRLWAAFFVHDLGYWSCYTMDGDDGKRHPELGGALMAKWFGEEWGSFTIRHSRSYAKLESKEVSALCAADKLAMAYDPKWFYLLRVWLTGEVQEYIQINYDLGLCAQNDLLGWYEMVKDYSVKSSLELAAQLKAEGEISVR